MKIEAATRQVEAAIAALVRGHFDIAITLAGAAEEMIDRKGSHLFEFLRDHPSAKPIDKKAWIRHLNRDRDWLKHASGPDRLLIERFSACVLIARAVTKLEASCWTTSIKDFQGWYVRNINELAEEFANREDKSRLD
jgi:hypothetical protein